MSSTSPRHKNRAVTMWQTTQLATKQTTPLAAWLADQIILWPRRLSPRRLARELGVEPHRVYAWLDGGAITPWSCLRLADYFRISLAELYVRANIPLRAAHELGIDDWRHPPDLHAASPSAQIAQLILASGYDTARQRTLMAWVYQKEQGEKT